MASLIKLRLIELQDIAKAMKIPKYEHLKKGDLIAIIQTRTLPRAKSPPVASKASLMAKAPPRAVKSPLRTPLTAKAPAIKEVAEPRVSTSTYTMGPQIGTQGRDAKAFMVKDKFGHTYAMKMFQSRVKAVKIKEEVQLQRRCSDLGISPKIVDYDTEKRFIVMEKMDGHLVDVLKSTNGLLSENLQKQLVHIFKMLDKANVFHGDANLMNYMMRDGRLYIIDFGYGKNIDDALVKKLKTPTPNMTLMLLGFVLKLKEIKCPVSSYRILRTHMPPEKLLEYKI